MSHMGSPQLNCHEPNMNDNLDNKESRTCSALLCSLDVEATVPTSLSNDLANAVMLPLCCKLSASRRLRSVVPSGTLMPGGANVIYSTGHPIFAGAENGGHCERYSRTQIGPIASSEYCTNTAVARNNDSNKHRSKHEGQGRNCRKQPSRMFSLQTCFSA